MLVTVAVLVIMMTILVQDLPGGDRRALRGAGLPGARQPAPPARRDDPLRPGGRHGRFTPPLDPPEQLGYFEYGENEFADIQGEDSDDYIRFTAKAPAGRPFTGRMWVPPPNSANLTSASTCPAGYQPVTITSEYAEIIYFLRNGNLYRRVLLVAPELQSAIVPTIGNTATIVQSGGRYTSPCTFNPSGLGGNTP